MNKEHELRKENYPSCEKWLVSWLKHNTVFPSGRSVAAAKEITNKFSSLEQANERIRVMEEALKEIADPPKGTDPWQHSVIAIRALEALTTNKKEEAI